MIAPDLAEVLLVEAAHRRRGCAEPDARGDGRRPLVERNGVAVRRHLDLVQALLGVLARPLARAQVELQQMRVGPSGEHVEPARDQLVRERVGVGADLALVVAEGLAGRDVEAGRLRGDHVLERTALHAREDRAVDRLRVLLAAEHEARRAGRRASCASST